MTLRDLFVFAVVMFFLPMGFRQPFIGLLLFSWLAYMRPQDLCWGFARTMRFSFIVGLAMIIGWFAHERGRRKFWRRDTRTWLMLGLCVTITVSLGNARFAWENTYVMRYYFEFIKIVAVALFTTGQVDTKARLRTLLWTICMCLAFFGVKGGVWGVLTGGGTAIIRGPGGMLEDNNDFALALVMNIPMMFYLARSEDKQILRQGAILAIMATMVTVLLTHSRGAFLSMVVTLMLMAWRSRKLIQATLVLGFLGIMFFTFAPSHVVERIASIGEGGKEASANARLRTWKIAFRMIDENPVLGVGMRNFQFYFRKNADPEDLEDAKLSYVAHNSYLQIWAENGSISFVLYLWLLGSVFWACRYVRRLGDRHGSMPWMSNYSRMIECTTIGFMCGAFFLNRGHFDLIYHWFALTSCLVYVARKEAFAAPVVEAANEEEQGRVEVRMRPVTGAMLPRWGR